MDESSCTEESSPIYPEKPVKPLATECCGNACSPCVFDIYEAEVRIWEKECARIQGRHSVETSGLADDPDQSLLSEEEYHQFQIVQCKEETRHSRRFSLAVPPGRTLGLSVGQHIIIRSQVQGTPVTRQYTPVSPISCSGHFELVVKLYHEGLMSQAIREWEAGDWIDVRGPFGTFTYTPNTHRTVLMLAAGTGVAPMAQVAAYILDNEEDETMIQLLYACRTYSDILLKSEMDQWGRFWNFSVTYALSQEDSSQPSAPYRYGDKIHFGRINRELVGEALESGDMYVLVCGTKAFEDDMIHHLQSLGLDQAQYFRF